MDYRFKDNSVIWHEISKYLPDVKLPPNEGELIKMIREFSARS
jgi:hypothetical protein